MPNRSLATSSKSSLSGRVKRCVTRNELPNFGSRSEVGRATSVKSGSASRKTAGSSACARATAGAAIITPRQSVSIRFTVTPLREMNGSVARRANRDPALQDQNLPVAEKRRTAERHAAADNARTPFNLVDKIAVFGISGDDANRVGLGAAGHVDQGVVRHVVVQGQP